MIRKLLFVTLIFGFIGTDESAWGKNWNSGKSDTNSSNALNKIPNHYTCGSPDSDGITYFEYGVKFKVDNKDIGKCPTDPHPFKSSKPYSERAEITFNYKLWRNKTHRIRFHMNISKGFSGPNRNETWFQVKCGTDSAVMAYFKKGHFPFKFRLANATNDERFVSRKSPIQHHYRMWFPIEIIYNNRVTSELSIYIDGQPIMEKQEFKQISDCRKTETFRLGIYRAGHEIIPNVTSEVMYKDIVFETLN